MINSILAVILIAISVAFTHADDKTCSSLKQEYQVGFKATLKCLERAPSCKEEVSRLLQKVGQIHACLPSAPENQGTGGGHSIKNLGGSKSGCDKEAKKLNSIPLYECLAEWNHSAKQQYKLPLPKDNCSTLVDPFITARDALYSCMAAKYPGVDPVRKIEF